MNGVPDVRAIEQDAAALGLRAEGLVEAADLEVWPEHWYAKEVAGAMGTQMNVAPMGGMIGYRYEALPAVMRFVGVPAAERAHTFLCLRVIENETVRLINGRRHG